MGTRIRESQYDAATWNRTPERRSELRRGRALLADHGELIQQGDEGHCHQDEQGNGVKAWVDPHPGREGLHPGLNKVLWQPLSRPRVLVYPGSRTVEADGQDDGQEEHLYARDPDRLEVDQDRDVLEKCFGKPDPQGVPVDGEMRTERQQERGARARDREPDRSQFAPPHGQYHQPYQQRYAQVAGWVGQLWRRSQDRSQKIDPESCDHTRWLNAVGDASRTGEEVPDRITGDCSEAKAGREQPGRCHADSRDDLVPVRQREQDQPDRRHDGAVRQYLRIDEELGGA